MKKVFRPFWSYDCSQTEKWLADMAATGLILVGLNRWTRVFFFQKGEPSQMTYRISYERALTASLPQSLQKEGWKIVDRSGNWEIVANAEQPEKIKVSPVREGIIRHNRKLQYSFAGILIYLSSIFVMNLITIGVSHFSDIPTEVVPSPWWYLTYTVIGLAIAIIVLSTYSIIKISQSNKRLGRESSGNFLPHGGSSEAISKSSGLPFEGGIPTGTDSMVGIEGDLTSETSRRISPESGFHYETSENVGVNGRFSRKKERQLKREGKLITKRKFAWMYSPDRLEQWLEAMEASGNNLYRVGNSGTVFHFIKGKPRKVSYCADYQNIANDSYFDFHREAGWKSVFISHSALQKWTIWSREYSEGEERPQIYSDKASHLKHARKVALAYTVLFLPLICMYLLLFGSYLEVGQSIQPAAFDLTELSMFVFVTIVFSSLIVRTWLYYFRLKKQINL